MTLVEARDTDDEPFLQFDPTPSAFESLRGSAVATQARRGLVAAAMLAAGTLLAGVAIGGLYQLLALTVPPRWRGPLLGLAVAAGVIGAYVEIATDR